MSVNSSKKVIKKSYSDIRLQKMKPMVFSGSRGIPSLEEMHVARNEKAKGGEVSYVHSVKPIVRKSASDSKKSTVHSLSAEKLSAGKQNCQAKSTDKKLLARKSGSYNRAKEVNYEGQAKVTSSETSLSARRKPISDNATKTPTKPKDTDKKPMQSAIKSVKQYRVALPAKSQAGPAKKADSRKEPTKYNQPLATRAASYPKSLAELAQRIVSSSNVSVTRSNSNVAPRAVENVNVVANRKWNTQVKSTDKKLLARKSGSYSRAKGVNREGQAQVIDSDTSLLARRKHISDNATKTPNKPKDTDKKPMQSAIKSVKQHRVAVPAKSQAGPAKKADSRKEPTKYNQPLAKQASSYPKSLAELAQRIVSSLKVSVTSSNSNVAPHAVENVNVIANRKWNTQAKSTDKKLLARKSGSYSRAKGVNRKGQAKVDTSDTSLSARGKSISDNATKTSNKPTDTDKKPIQSAIKSVKQHRVAVPAKSQVGTSKQADSRKEPTKCNQLLVNQAASYPKSLAKQAQRMVSSLNISVINSNSNVAPRAVENVNVIANRKWNTQAKATDKKLLARKSGSYNRAKKVNCEGQAKVTSSDTTLSARRKPISDNATKTPNKPKYTDKKPMPSAIKSVKQHGVAVPAKSQAGPAKKADSRKEPSKCNQPLATQAASYPKSLAELAQMIVLSSNISVTSSNSNAAPRAVENVKVITNRKWNTDLDYNWFNTYTLPDVNEIKPNAKASEFEKWQRGERKDCTEMCVNESLSLQEVFLVVDSDGKSRFVDKDEDKDEKISTFGSVVMGVMKNLFGMYDNVQTNSVWVV